jgi:hypothetical protein
MSSSYQKIFLGAALVFANVFFSFGKKQTDHSNLQLENYFFGGLNEARDPAVLRITNKRSGQRCTGVLIEAGLALTYGACVADRSKGSDIEIRYINGDDSYETTTAKLVYVSPKSMDIAGKSRAEYEESVPLAALVLEDKSDIDSDKIYKFDTVRKFEDVLETFYVIGYGSKDKRSNVEHSSQLKAPVLLTNSWEKTFFVARAGIFETRTLNGIHAGPCFGDEGSPIFSSSNEGEPRTLVGMFVRAVDSKVNEEKTCSIGIYTNTATILDFVKEFKTKFSDY